MNVVLIPAFNEEKTIAKVIADAFDFCDAVVVCDDGSTDATSKIAESQGCTIVRHERNLGKGAALRSLFQEAVKMQASTVITIDADGQHDANDIPKLLKALEDADVVIGGRKGSSTVRALGNMILSSFSEIDTQSGFRAYRGQILGSLIPSEMGMAVDLEIFKEAERLRLRVVQVPVSTTYKVPKPHKTNTMIHFFDVLLTNYKLATFRHPLMLYGIPGIVLVLSSLWFGIRSFNLSMLGVGQFPVVITLGLFSVYLMLVGLAALSTGIIIWTVVTMERRIAR